MTVNEWAQRRDFNFSINELLEQNELFMRHDKFISSNYRAMARKQLNMLVENSVLIRVLIKEEGKGKENRYYTRPLSELETEYDKLNTQKHAHQAPHIFDVMYWERRRNIE